MGGACNCAELPEGLRGVVEERLDLEAGLNGLVTVENTSGQFFVVSFFRPQIFWCDAYWESGTHGLFPEKDVDRFV